MKIHFKEEVKSGDKLNPAEIAQLILKNRKFSNISDFLNPVSPLKISLLDFGNKAEFKKVLKLLSKIKKNQEMIVVYTDYDADGITGGAILWETLYLLGFNVMPYVPHRKLEGYGFSKKGIDAVKKKYNPSLVISVDHGITAREKIKYAKSLGIKVIVTDHHLKPEKLPTDAFAIFHIPELSGSGVAYFFAKEIFKHFRSNRAIEQLNNFFSTDYLALAAIGTIADLVPLIGPSRSVVKHGLVAFAKTRRFGLRHILKEAGIEGKKITPYEVGFIIAPRINAVGRLEHAIDALRLLCTTNEDKARELASHAAMKNRERQAMVEKSVEEAKIMLQATSYKLSKIIILVSHKWHEGIIGLIAAKITEKYHRPTIVMTESNGFLKGSARSIYKFHITNFLRELRKYLIDVGGHKGAAGFTIEKNKLIKFEKAAEKLANKLIKDTDLEEMVEVDLKIPISQINMRLAQELEKLEPFGIGNSKPIFYSQAKIIDIKLFGKNGNHLKILVKGNSFPLELIFFNNPDVFYKLARGNEVEIIYNLEINRFRGLETLRGKVLAIYDPQH